MDKYYYMCIAFNEDNTFYIQPKFFKNIYEANVYASNKAISIPLHFFSTNVYIDLSVGVFKIPYTFIADTEFEQYTELFKKYKMYHVSTKSSLECSSARIIQKYYKLRFKKRMDSIIFLQYSLRKAIANPRTKLCYKRLIREFNGM